MAEQSLPTEWDRGLNKCGNYCEGWVSDIDDRLSSHARATVTCYGTRRSIRADKVLCNDSWPRVYTDQVFDDTNTESCCVATKHLECMPFVVVQQTEFL